ncbi:MAG TPA: type II toxin-antitoxin system VapC family toxin [Acidobacteriaceae bacterium]
MRFYLDSMVWIYLIEGNPQFGTAVQSILSGVRAGGHTLLTSNFLLAEILVEPVRKKDAFTVASYRRMLVESSAVEVVPFTAETAVQFAAIRAAHRTSSPDSLHLALAASGGADVFVTGDGRLTKLSVSGIGRIVDLSFRLP